MTSNILTLNRIPMPSVSGSSRNYFSPQIRDQTLKSDVKVIKTLPAIVQIRNRISPAAIAGTSINRQPPPLIPRPRISSPIEFREIDESEFDVFAEGKPQKMKRRKRPLKELKGKILVNSIETFAFLISFVSKSIDY